MKISVSLYFEKGFGLEIKTLNAKSFNQAIKKIKWQEIQKKIEDGKLYKNKNPLGLMVSSYKFYPLKKIKK